jgi:hypothetical protein
MKRNKPKIQFAALLAFCWLFLFSDSAFSQTPFYQGKTLTIVHGRAAGGSGDFRVRAVTPFLQKYIPGNPAIVHEYMDGGGGRKAANHIFNSARPDGLTIGNVGGGVVANAVLGETGVQYDLDKMPFIGSPYSATHYVLLTRREAGFRTLDKLRQASGVRFGAQSVGHTNYTIARIFSWLLGLKEHKDVTGFSIPERDVALLRGEIDAVVSSDDLLVRNAEWLEKGLIDLHAINCSSKGGEASAFLLLAGNRWLCQNRQGAQIADHVSQLQIDRLAVYCASIDAQGSSGNYQRGSAQKFQRSRVFQGIPQSRRGRSDTAHARGE